MKDRSNDFKDYAWEIARQNKCSSEVNAIEQGIRLGYKLAIKDSSELIAATLEGIRQDRIEGNKPK